MCICRPPSGSDDIPRSVNDASTATSPLTSVIGT
jgi:hypothetical protein